MSMNPSSSSFVVAALSISVQKPTLAQRQSTLFIERANFFTLRATDTNNDNNSNENSTKSNRGWFGSSSINSKTEFRSDYSQQQRASPYEEQYKQYQQQIITSASSNSNNNNNNNDDKVDPQKSTKLQPPPKSLITPEMEQEVLSSVKAKMDNKTVSRAVSSLIDGKERKSKSNDDRISVGTMTSVKKTNLESNIRQNTNSSTMQNAKNNNKQNLFQNTNNNSNNRGYKSGRGSSGSNLRNLVSRMEPPTEQLRNNNISTSISSNDSDNSNNSSWNTQQIALASGATTFFTSPIIIPILHSLLPPIIPFPSSVSFEGAAFLGALAYIVAVSDPTESNAVATIVSKQGGGGNSSLGEGVEVTGAVSRIVGRTALKSVQTTTPRLQAAARAVVDYDSTTSILAEMENSQRELSSRLADVEYENDQLRYELALWNGVESVSGMYKLEELKEMARYEGVRGYSSDGKNALMRRLVREGILELDLSPFYSSLDELEDSIR